MNGGIETRVSNSSTSKRDKKRNLSRSILEIPSSVVSDSILLRLSVKDVLVCKCVCKTWFSLISDPNFAKLHFEKSQVSVLFRSFSSKYISRTLYLVEPQDFIISFHGSSCEGYWPCDCMFNKKLDTKLKIPLRDSDSLLANYGQNNANVQSRVKISIKPRPSEHKFIIANSCRGLLCLSEPIRNEPLAVCNPITGEYINLPVLTQGDWRCKIKSDCALGFSPRANQYKVIRMFYKWNPQWTCEPITGQRVRKHRLAQIHTLGTSSWRMIGDAPSSTNMLGFPTYLNGAVHWLYLDGKKIDVIVAFNFDSEEFHPIPPPPRDPGIFDFGASEKVSLGELRGFLCMCHHIGEELFLWVMRDYGVQQSWTKEHRLKTSTPKGIEISGVFEPLTALSNGALLVLHPVSNFVFYYDSDTADYKRLNVCGLKTDYEVIRFTPSFISLKDSVIGGDMEVLNIQSRCAVFKLPGETKVLSLEELRPFVIKWRLSRPVAVMGT